MESQRPDPGLGVQLQLEEALGHRRAVLVELLLSPLPRRDQDRTGDRFLETPPTSRQGQAAHRVGWRVPGVKVPASAAEYPVSFLHGRFSNALEHGGSRLRRLASSGRVSEGFYRILPESLKWSQIWSHCDQKRDRPEQFHFAFNDLQNGSGGSGQSLGIHVKAAAPSRVATIFRTRFQNAYFLESQSALRS